MLFGDSRFTLISVVKTWGAFRTARTYLCTGALKLSTVTRSTICCCAHVLFPNWTSAASDRTCHVGVFSCLTRLTRFDAFLSDQRQKCSCFTILANIACVFVLAGWAFAGAVCRVAQQARNCCALGVAAAQAFYNGINWAVVAVKLALG